MNLLLNKSSLERSAGVRKLLNVPVSFCTGLCLQFSGESAILHSVRLDTENEVISCRF